MRYFVYIAALSLFLSACSSTPSRYQHKHDFVPESAEQVKHYKEPTPREEPLSTMGNPESYVVFGKRYKVKKSAIGYKERGEASWYGMKFHGHQTSNGETYDVYQYTAAHKSLPLPSYVKVTRLDTNTSVVVRVNDRGPFHPGRIIDLSYAAAIKLGIDKIGVAQVEVEVLQPPKNESERWLQVGAFKNKDSALALQDKVREQLGNAGWPIVITNKNDINRVRVGPIPEGELLQQVIQQLEPLNLNTISLAAHQL